jgi:hypothetical protein
MDSLAALRETLSILAVSHRLGSFPAPNKVYTIESGSIRL